MFQFKVRHFKQHSQTTPSASLPPLRTKVELVPKLINLIPSTLNVK
jgi:hypothetical protein